MGACSTLQISRTKALALYAEHLTPAGKMSDQELGDALDPFFESRLLNILVVTDDRAEDDDVAEIN